MDKIISKEKDLHKNVVEYLKWQYPNVIFHTDFAAGMKMTIGQAVRNKGLQSEKSWPDLFIAEPRNGWHGLFIEIKKDFNQVYKKDMSFKKSTHIEEQKKMINKLKLIGYQAFFGCGFYNCKKIIDDYLKNK